MSRVDFIWNGPAVVERVRGAARDAVNATLEEAAADAEASHPWVNRTGQLDAEIAVEHAKPGDSSPSGAFGTTRRRGFYGMFHELATRHEHEHPFLRPAADRHFGTLAEKIKERLK